MKRGPLPKLSPEQVAEIFERLTTTDVAIKVLAFEYGVDPTTLQRTLTNAEKNGLALWRRNTWNVAHDL